MFVAKVLHTGRYMKMKNMLLASVVFLAAGLNPFTADAQRVDTASSGSVDVLIYTRWDFAKDAKTGKGVKGGIYGPRKLKPYLHDSTYQGAEETRRYFTANGFRCLVTEDPAFFTSDAMKSLKLIMLCSCNHELFDTDAQREAFYAFVKKGGGLLAVHSSSACERGSERFRKFLGGAFERHYAKHQRVPFRRADRSHPAIACLPADYVWADDEIYLNHPDEASVHPTLILEWNDVLPESRKRDKHGCPKIGGHILEWCKMYGKGRIYYTALGHNPEDWGKMEWQMHLLEAAKWAMGMTPDRVGDESAKPVVRTTIDGVECVEGEKTVWKFNIANRENKPFVHPLCLPDGRCVTDARPKDHPWHLGLWFCWKYINGLNYWEPRNPPYSNLFPAGMTVLKDFKIVPKGGACEVTLSMWYGPRTEPGNVLLEEERKVCFSEPDEKGAYKIRSTHVFTAKDKVNLDARRPVAYGGFSLRMAKMMRGFEIHGIGGEPDAKKNIGGPKDMTAVRYVDPKNGHGIEMKMLAPLDAERIYTWSDHCFVNPMPIYERAKELSPGDTFTLDYEVSVF